MARRRSPTRRSVVTDVDLRAAAELCGRDPVATVLAAMRIESVLAAGAGRGGATVWGMQRGGVLDALCWMGANMVPVCDPQDTDALDAFAEKARRYGRRCSSIVGEARPVLGLWDRLAPSWGPARDVRPDQPSLVIGGAPAVAADPQVRPARPDEFDLVLPASVHMFLEEVGYSPLNGGAGAYEARVRALVDAGRTFVRIEDGPDGPEVVFKADVGGSPVARPAALRARHGRGRGADPRPGRAARLALRQQLQRRRAGVLPQGRLPPGRDLRDDPLLTASLTGIQPCCGVPPPSPSPSQAAECGVARRSRHSVRRVVCSAPHFIGGPASVRPTDGAAGRAAARDPSWSNEQQPDRPREGGPPASSRPRAHPLVVVLMG